MHEVTPDARMGAVEDVSGRPNHAEPDPESYASPASGQSYCEDPRRLPDQMKRRMLDVGVTADEQRGRSGTFIQVDNCPVHFSLAQEGIELMPVRDALKKHDWLSDLWWRVVEVGTDRYTSFVDDHADSNGYFIRALPGQKTLLPLQACLYLGTEGLAQSVHNVVVAEENSELHIITGCTTEAGNSSGLHLGVSEFYVRKGAKLTFTMIHNWEPGISVRPRTGVIIEEGATFISNYAIMKPVHDVQSNPVVHCVGEGATAYFNNVAAGFPGGVIDLGSSVFLDAPRSRTEIVSRAILMGGQIIARGYIEGNARDVKGHLECRGLLLSDEDAVLHAIPELRGTVAGIDLSHEAAVGKIAEEEVQYLMARGLTRNEATSAIVRGFLHVDIEGLPDALNAELQRAIEASEEDMM